MEENKNLKVDSLDMSVIFYPKTNKLITALYMVTDIMEKEEPLRNKLRTLGINIISDIYSLPRQDLSKNIDEVLSFLDIASAINLISEMNCNILKKEFIQLKQSLQENSGQDLTLSELFADEPISRGILGIRENGNEAKGQMHIGVQKGNTLMKALSDKIPNLSNNNVFKKQRRESILKIIKGGDEMSIKDIDLALQGLGEKCGEKTLQRVLVSMVNDGVLNKTGSKRWSRYRLKI